MPLAILENFLPEEFTNVSERISMSTACTRCLATRGFSIRVARQRIGARRATTEESTLLQMDSHDPVLTMDRTAYDSSGRAVEYGHHAYRPDLYSFEMSLVAK